MKVNSIANYNQNNIHTKNPNFKNYAETLSKATKTEIKDTISGARLFNLLFKELTKEEFTQKNPIFYEIEKIYKEMGFLGLLEELRLPDSQSYISKLLAEKELDFINIVTQYGQPLFQLFHFGKFGGGREGANDIRVIFSQQNQTKNIEFNLGKKMNLNIGRNDGYTTVDTEYYTTTGTPKVIVENSGGLQTKTFYNEDGSRPFFKNLLRGGTAISAG